MLPEIISILVGAFLLFQVQPLIVNYILPWFGGGPAIWSTALVFFQVLLIAGYGYAHLVRRALSPKRQVVVHSALLAVAVVMLPIVPAESFKPTTAESPARGILLTLSATIGIPYFLLAATSPLMQAWAVAAGRTRTPYPLYALSNTGSLVALLSYPFVFEPLFGKRTQIVIWSWCFVLFAVASLWAAGVFLRSAAPSESHPMSDQLVTRTKSITRLDRSLWILLPAAASILLLAVTNEISQDIAATPLLWVVPLALYLVTFIIAFAKHSGYRRWIYLPALVPAAAGMVWVLYTAGTTPIGVQFGLFSFGLFVCAMVCHGELARLKPHPAHLTEYYLWIAVGGASGGAFVALVAPLVFVDYLETHVGILACLGLVLIVLLTSKDSPMRGGKRRWAWLLAAGVYVGFSYALTRHIGMVFQSAVAKERSFYGVLTVTRSGQGEGETLTLRNGMISHGVQYTSPQRSRLPTTYYSHQSGVGIVLRAYSRPSGRRIGVVGLGVGTVAAYARGGDTLRVYEINSQVTDLARAWFRYMEESPAHIEVVHGDARILLEREPPQRFDVLVLDAFSGDAIPVHLLTREAFELYRHHLAEDGVLVVHLSNRHLNLEPIVGSHGDWLNLMTAHVRSPSAPNQVWPADWTLMTADTTFMEQDDVRNYASAVAGARSPRPWTDDYVNLFAVLRSPW